MIANIRIFVLWKKKWKKSSFQLGDFFLHRVFNDRTTLKKEL